MSISNGDIIKVVMEVLLESGTISQNVYYFIAALTSPEGNTSVTTEVETWIEALYSNLSSQLPNSMTQRVCSVDQIEWNATEEFWETVQSVGLFTPTIGFNNAGEPLPNQCAALATFHSLLPRSRGRKFLFPFAEDQQDASFLVAAALTALAAYAADAMDVITFAPLNTLTPGIVRTAVGVFLEFNNATVTDLIHTQRRRTQGVGI